MVASTQSNVQPVAQFSAADFARVEQITTWPTDDTSRAIQEFDFEVFPESTASVESNEDDGTWHVCAGHVRFAAFIGEGVRRSEFRRQAASFERAVRAFAAAHASA